MFLPPKVLTASIICLKDAVRRAGRRAITTLAPEIVLILVRFKRSFEVSVFNWSTYPVHLHQPITMSDFEDDMDIDERPAKDTAITFGAETKGKRSAANLPVEAEDTLPWSDFQSNGIASVTDNDRVEKYRPDTLDDVSGHQDILATINKFVDSNVCSPSGPHSPTPHAHIP